MSTKRLPTARIVASGQLLRVGCVAPLFQIYNHDLLDEGPYNARIISHRGGRIIADSSETETGNPFDGFKTIGEAMEWCYGFVDY